MLHQVNFTYKTCSIHHDAYVDKLDIHHNFVFVTKPLQSQIMVHLIDDADLENDNDTLQSVSIYYEGTLELLHYFSQIKELIVVTSNPAKLSRFKLIEYDN